MKDIYLNERLTRMREKLWNTRPAITAERIVLATEAYKQFAGDAVPIFRAKVCNYVMEQHSFRAGDFLIQRDKGILELLFHLLSVIEPMTAAIPICVFFCGDFHHQNTGFLRAIGVKVDKEASLILRGCDECVILTWGEFTPFGVNSIAVAVFPDKVFVFHLCDLLLVLVLGG